MDRDAIIARLRASEAELRARGAAHAALFGSRARGDNRPDSDIDIEPGAADGVYAYVALTPCISGLFAGPVDVVDRESLKPHVRPSATADASGASRHLPHLVEKGPPPTSPSIAEPQ